MFMKIGSLLALSLSLLFSCQGTSREESEVVSAQSCLDRLKLSQSSEALNCVANLTDIDTPQANMLKCSALFIKQGFSDPSRLAQVADQMTKSGAQGSNGTAAVIGLMAFSGSSAQQESEDAMTYCQKSGSKGMTLLASLTSVATALSAIGDIINQCTGDSIDMNNCANEVRDNICTSSSADLGSVALVTYSTSCSGVELTNPMCEAYRIATNNGQNQNPTEIGDTLKDYINGTPCP